ncbi:MAG TPA: hypothetical protein VFI47_03015 [Acidimicrobiales bacterium]|nr:hypothetical protein [Acidimicrobiales bacterium]
MSRAPGGPGLWWTGWKAPVVDDVLYRTDEWVDTFLSDVDAELSKLRLGSVTLEADRPALVVTGESEPETLRVHRATYRDVLLFHPGLHADVEAAVNAAVVAAAGLCARLGFHAAEDLRVGGRELLLEQPGTLLHADVVEGLRALDLSGLPPVGISGVVEVRSKDAAYVLAVLRSDRVAVNPGCLGPAVDGGLSWTATEIDPEAGLRNEIKVELPWLDHDDLELVGTLLPPASPTLLGGSATRRCGVNVVYRASVAMEPHEVFRRAPDHFEITELVLIETSGARASQGLPSLLTRRDEGLPTSLPLSEPLALLLAREDVIDVTIGTTTSPRTPRPQRRPTKAKVMSPALHAKELTLDDAWAEDLIERHSRLSRVLARDSLSELGESGEPSLENLGPVFDAVREYEFVRSSDRIKASDDARLFEALVYRLGRYLFANSEAQALRAHDLMLPRGRAAHASEMNPIGVTYTQRLDDVKEQDAEVDPDSVWRKEVTSALDALNRDEAVQEYSEVARRGRLLCFCAALWILELKRSPEAAMVALDDRYRKSLSGEVIALFFRARGLLVSPVISAAQAQLGLQFVTTALATYDRNPGMHHTKANFLLRQSALTEIEAVSVACLEQALMSVETALESDAEFPTFYATRAKVKHRLRDRAGALIDIRAAIELARYSASSPAVRQEIGAWEDILEGWQLAPVSGAGG